MNNITVTMADTLAEWLRVEAAKRGSSVSCLLGESLAEQTRQADAYAQAILAAISFESRGASSGPYVPRETLFLR